MYTKSLRLPVIAFIACSGLSSCIDDKYDLSKNISTDISLGSKSIYLPLGSTEELKIKDLIDIDNSENLIIEDGQYFLRKDEKMSSIKVSAEEITVKQFTVEFETYIIDFSNNYLDKVPEEALDRPVLVSQSITGLDSKFEIKQSIPKEIVSLISALANKGKSLPRMSFSLSLKGLDSSVEEVYMQDIEIQLPSFIKYNDSNSKIKIKDNIAKVPNITFNPHFGWSDSGILIESVDFSDFTGGRGVVADNNNNIFINEKNEVNLTGNFLAFLKMGVLAEQNNIEVIPRFIIDEFTVSNIEAILNPDIDDSKTTIQLDLADDLDFLKEDAILNLYNPQISLSMKSSAGIPFNVETQLEAFDKNMTPIDGSKVEIKNIEIKKATLDNDNKLEPAISNILISGASMDVEDGIQHIIKPELSNLFNSIPDYIKLVVSTAPSRIWTRENIMAEDITKEIIQEEKHIIDFNNDMEISSSCYVNIPLEFKELSINYKDTINNLQSELKNLIDIVKNLQLGVTMKVKNTIPCTLQLEAKAYDINGNTLHNIDLVFEDKDGKEAIVPASCDEGKEMTLKIKAENEELKTLDKIVLYVKGNIAHSETAEALKENQYIKIENMTLFIDGNIEMEIK